MSNRAIKGFHLVRFGTAADQKFLLGDILPTYDQLIINANMVAHMPSALASFLSVKVKNKPYFIDPQTHAFQHDIGHIESSSPNKVGEIKRSIKNLIDSYGQPISTSVGSKRQPVVPSDFKSDMVIQRFCERVLKFQIKAISDEIQESDVSKYYRYANQAKGIKSGGIFEPSLVIAPYFYMTSSTVDEWLNVNLQCIEKSKKVAKSFQKPLGTQLVISNDLLQDKEQLRKVIQGFTSLQPDVFLVWVDSFVEQNASEYELTQYTELFRQLSRDTPVVNLFGGFFSVALRKTGILKNLVGVAHGLEYGESRPVVPVGGGIPVAKFYFPALYARLKFRDALRAVRKVGGMKSLDGFYANVCDCKMCKEAIKSNPEEEFAKYGESKAVLYTKRGAPVSTEYPLQETKERTVQHYMWCKKKEFKGKYVLEEVIRDLGKARKQLENVLGLGGVAHCLNWSKVLNQNSEYATKK